MLRPSAGSISNCLSVACVLHCLAMPIIVALLPAIGIAIVAKGAIEMVLILLAISLCLCSLCWGYRRHKNYLTFSFLISGAIWLFMSHYYHHSFTYSILGCGSLIFANILNKRLCKKCQTCNLRSPDGC